MNLTNASNGSSTTLVPRLEHDKRSWRCVLVTTTWHFFDSVIPYDFERAAAAARSAKQEVTDATLF